MIPTELQKDRVIFEVVHRWHQYDEDTLKHDNSNSEDNVGFELMVIK